MAAIPSAVGENQVLDQPPCGNSSRDRSHRYVSFPPNPGIYTFQVNSALSTQRRDDDRDTNDMAATKQRRKAD
jgi:hypothetical protein